ncbi:MAG: hypothetical protein H8E44_21230 [Planctomycetes bacterium]|nr:hypothetical protein [Planctomycetota bacterium]
MNATPNLSKKRIIMIHGLAAKPPANDLHRLWSKCLVENIRLHDPELGTAIDSCAGDLLAHAYWANATPHHIEDDRAYVKKLGIQVDNVIAERKTHKDGFHVGLGEKLGGFFKKRGEDVAKLFTRALTVKDDVAKAFLRETELYDEDQFIADEMRRPLEEELRRAWDEKKDVALISHSMGTFIAYDVLWRFSHRSVAGFKRYRRKKVQMFVTMGSPLGDSVIRGFLFSRHHKDGKRPFPTNIQMWHNYSCLGDVVSHPSTLESKYFEPMKAVGLFSDKRAFRHLVIDYDNLHNPFEVVTHPGNKKEKEKRDPHKSYGYLVQPRLGSWTSDFLRGKLRLP